MTLPMSLAATAFAMGAALASAPGQVQAVIVNEAARGGVRRGLRAMIGASATFAVLLAALALGVSISPPRGPLQHLLRVAGGVVLVWLAWDGWRASEDTPDDQERHGQPATNPALRGMLSVALNPGAWLFLAAVAAPLLTAASSTGGRAGSLFVGGAMAIGAASGDGLIVVASGLGLRRISDRSRCWTTRVLNVVLAGLGTWLLATGIASLTNAG